MVTFFNKVALLLALIGVTFVAIMLFPAGHGSYLASVIDKQARLQSTASPKLVFVGGSNLAFGIDSPRIERELGYPVVNMGLGINAGFRFLLDSTAPHINSGDIVVVMPEYHLFYGLWDGDDELLDVLEAYPEGLRHVRTGHQLYVIARNLPMHAKQKFNRLLKSIGREGGGDCLYCRRGLNEYGDLMSHLEMEPEDLSDMELFRRKVLRTIDDDAIEGLNRYLRRIQAKGAQAFVMYAPIPTKQYDENLEKIQTVRDRLEADPAAPILGTPEENTYPLEYFFDWVYHLTGEGREVRTAQVIERLRAALASS